MIRTRRCMVDPEGLAGEDRGALLKNLTDSELKAPATRQKIKARCTGFYGGNSLRKSMPRRTKLCYGCRLARLFYMMQGIDSSDIALPLALVNLATPPSSRAKRWAHSNAHDHE